MERRALRQHKTSGAQAPAARYPVRWDNLSDHGRWMPSTKEFSMTRMWACVLLVSMVGCANRRWGFPEGQGTIERQKARAAVHDPYPLNDIGPEVVGGRPREFY